MDGFDILFPAMVCGHSFLFQLDSGARTSLLYHPFYVAFREELEATQQLTTEDVTGLGGTEEVPVYRLEEIELELGEHTVTLARITVSTQKLDARSETCYGLMGRDLMRRFQSLTLNFESMTIRVVGLQD